MDCLTGGSTRGVQGIDVHNIQQSMIFFRKIAFAVLSVAFSEPAVAHAAPIGAFADKYAAIVIDANSGKTLFEEKANIRRYPASLTKMMTLYLLFEAMQAGRMSRNTLIPVSAYAASRPPTKMGFTPGQRIAAETAAKALITRSANDVAVAIGEYLGGSEKNFARMMTLKARRLGMRHTNFTNASGLPDMHNYSTARDMAILAVALRAHFPRYYRLFQTTSFVFRGRHIEGHNQLVKSMQGVDGIKTGYTRMSGFNLASSRYAEGKSIVAVVMGGRTVVSRDAHMANLLERYIDKASNAKAPAPLFASRSVIRLPESRAIPIPVAKASLNDVITGSANSVLAVAQAEPSRQVISQEMIELPADGDIPVPVAKISVHDILADKGRSETLAVSDREHDSALLTALASQDFRPSAAAAAADEILIRNPPVPADRSVHRAASVTASSAADEKKGWVIQIASLPSQNEADDILDKALGTVRSVLAEAEPYTQFFEKGASHYYRARFGGFLSRQAAANACAKLEKENFNCYTLKN